MKQCSKCRLVKSPTEFHKDATKPDGLARQCKSCKSSLARAYQAQPHIRLRRGELHACRMRLPGAREHAAERARDWRKANPEKARAQSYRWAAENHEKVLAKHRRRSSRDTESLPDRYIARLLGAGMTCRRVDIPAGLIALKRTHIQINRELKQRSAP